MTDDQIAASITRGHCPVCQYRGFVLGPRGGAAQNIECGNLKCRARFNVTIFAGDSAQYQGARHTVPLGWCDVIVERIRPMLAGQSPDVIGAVLGDLTAIWLAGHRGGDPNGLIEFRAEILAAHLEYVRSLVELYDRQFAAGDWPPGRQY